MELRKRGAKRPPPPLDVSEEEEEEVRQPRKKRGRASRGNEREAVDEAAPVPNPQPRKMKRDRGVEVDEVDEAPPVPDPEPALPIVEAPVPEVDENEVHRAHYQQQTRRTAENMAPYYAHFDPERDLYDVRFKAGVRTDDDVHEEDLPELSFPKPKKVDVDWRPSRNGEVWRVSRRPPSLFDLSVGKLCENINGLESLDEINDAIRRSIITNLSKLGKVTSRVVKLLFSGTVLRIVIPDCSKLTVSEFSQALDSCDLPAVQSLELGFCGRVLPDEVVNKLHLPQLHQLELQGGYLFTDESLSTVFRIASGLTSVKLIECEMITVECIQALADSVGSRLQELAIVSCPNIRDKELVHALLRFTALRLLSLAGLVAVTDDVLTEIMVNLGSTLTELDISDCTQVGDAGIASIAACGSGLCRLGLGNLDKTTDLSLERLGETCLSLQKISLCGSKKYSDEQLAKFFSACGTTICDVSLSLVRHAGDNTLVALGTHASRTLKTLDASFCRDMTDDGFGYLADSCSFLTELRLFGCTQLTSRFMTGHSNKSLKIVGDPLTWTSKI